MRNQILKSFDDVGESKSVGYLPIRTVIDVLRLDFCYLERVYGKKGLTVVSFDSEETCINGGAIFVFDGESVRNILKKHSLDVAPDSFIKMIASKWYAKDSEMMPIIFDLYGELA